MHDGNGNGRGDVNDKSVIYIFECASALTVGAHYLKKLLFVTMFFGKRDFRAITSIQKSVARQLC